MESEATVLVVNAAKELGRVRKGLGVKEESEVSVLAWQT